MRSKLGRGVVVACCLVLIAQVLIVWGQTGFAGLTRYYDPERARHEARDAALNAVLDDPTSAPTPPLGPPNTFALGLLPFGLGRHSISVVTLATPVLIALVVALRGANSRRGNSSEARSN